MQRILAITVLFVLAGCASKGMDEAQCRSADWRAIGYEDGARGLGTQAFGKHRRACAEHGVTAGFDAYLGGHGEGLAVYCRPQNGYRLGIGGYRYSGVCPAHLEAAFAAAHADGFGLYQRKTALNRIGRRLSTNKARAKEIEYLLVEKAALVISPTLLAPERAALAIELKQLGEEKVEIEQSILRLERDHAEAQRDYEQYRGQLADRHRG